MKGYGTLICDKCGATDKAHSGSMSWRDAKKFKLPHSCGGMWLTEWDYKCLKAKEEIVLFLKKDERECLSDKLAYLLDSLDEIHSDIWPNESEEERQERENWWNVEREMVNNILKRTGHKGIDLKVPSLSNSKS